MEDRPGTRGSADNAPQRTALTIAIDSLCVGVLVSLTFDGLFQVTAGSVRAGSAAAVTLSCFYLLIKPVAKAISKGFQP